MPERWNIGHERIHGATGADGADGGEESVASVVTVLTITSGITFHPETRPFMHLMTHGVLFKPHEMLFLSFDEE